MRAGFGILRGSIFQNFNCLREAATGLVVRISGDDATKCGDGDLYLLERVFLVFFFKCNMNT